MASALSAACAGSDHSPGVVDGPSAPVSADAPQPAGSVVRAPSEPREPLVGDSLVVVDSAFHVAYEFDLGRMRFRGPAPRVALSPGPVALAGYPVPVSANPPQDVTAVGNLAVVAGGLDGTLVLLDRSKGDLAVSQTLLLPVRNVTSDTGERSSNGSSDTGKPFITLAGRLGADDALLVSYEIASRTSVGYAVELSDRSLIKGTQLPGGGAAVAVQPYGDGAVAAMSSRKLVVLSRELASVRELALPGVPTHMAVVGDTAWVSVTGPVRLVRVDLATGSARVVSEDPKDKLGGPVVVADGTVWWALRERGLVRRITVSNGKASDLKACEGASSMVRYRKMLFVTCPGPKTVDVLRDHEPTIAFHTPNFPVSAAVLAP